MKKKNSLFSIIINNEKKLSISISNRTILEPCKYICSHINNSYSYLNTNKFICNYPIKIIVADCDIKKEPD